MPVKVADRYDTGCADANLTGSLLIYELNYISKITVLSTKIPDQIEELVLNKMTPDIFAIINHFKNKISIVLN